MSLQIGYLMDKLYNMDKNLGGTAAMSRGEFNNYYFISREIYR
jgi:hypothetical protein